MTTSAANLTRSYNVVDGKDIHPLITSLLAEGKTVGLVDHLNMFPTEHDQAYRIALTQDLDAHQALAIIRVLVGSGAAHVVIHQGPIGQDLVDVAARTNTTLIRWIP